MTMSFGVSASDGETAFSYELLFAEADAALYEAKRAGRNRVRRVAPSAVPVLA